MLIREYRIPMPLSVSEYRRGQLYMIARCSLEQSNSQEGVEFLVNEPYEDENGKGQFTHKVFYISSALPGWMRALIPSSVGNYLRVEEKAWNQYPYVKNEYFCAFMGDRFTMSIETRYLDDSGNQENALSLSESDLASREIEFIDISSDQFVIRNGKANEDPSTFVSQKTQRGPLKPGWAGDHTPIMCCYKVIKVDFRYWGLQTRIEQYIHRYGLRDLLLLGHRQCFCWIDEWFDLTIEEIREMEKRVQKELDELRQEDYEEESE